MSSATTATHQRTTAAPFARRLPVGVELSPEGRGAHARVWAPARKHVAFVQLEGEPREIELQPDGDGYFAAAIPEARAGTLYKFRLDRESDLFPDPVSRSQPQGVHGPSEIVDPHAFRWTDDAWQGLTATGNVLYELHVGTFTEAGTFVAVIERLPYLRDLGVNVIELMPVNAFGGRWNWGYDGVYQFAPTHNYGTPDDLRRLIDAAHAQGIGIILDVVYNHFGPDGNYLERYSSQYFSQKHKNDWGKQINFDGDGSAGVREYFVANARHWIEEYHFDGFRFDATQAIIDESPRHVLADICMAARQAAGERSIYLINENEPQHTRLVRPQETGGIGMDALWNDDFHHAARVAMTGRRDAYFTDYNGTPQELLSAVKWGYLYQGQIYRWQQKRRGTPGLDLPPTAFVNYIQNHDQIANYAHGERLTRHTSLQHLRTITALLLLAPQTPMLFMGQEWAATSRFLYFADHCDPLPGLIAEGRKREMSQFASVGSAEVLAALPAPCDPATFQRCKLDWSELDREEHQQMLRLHRDLIRLRREDPILRRVQNRGDIDGAVVDSAFVIRFFGQDDDDRLLLINLGSDDDLQIVPEPLLAPPMGMRWTTLLSTESARYGGNGYLYPETRGESWRLPGENWRLLSRCATVLRAAPESVADAEEAARDEALARQRGERP